MRVPDTINLLEAAKIDATIAKDLKELSIVDRCVEYGPEVAP